MDSNLIIKALKTEPMSFSLEEIREMMDEELEKDPSEMDAALIDLCLDILEKGDDGNAETKLRFGKRRVRLKRVLWLAATVMLIAATVLPTTMAEFRSNSVSEKIAPLVNRFYKVEMSLAKHKAERYYDYDNDIANAFKKKGVSTLVLPTKLFGCEVVGELDFKRKHNEEDLNGLTEGEDFSYYAELNIKDPNSELTGSIDIDYTSPFYKEVTYGSPEFSKTCDAFEQFERNGIDVFVVHFKSGGYTHIIYCDGRFQYDIFLKNCSAEQALEIAESVR